MMDCAGHEFLARSGFTFDQNRRVRISYLLDQPEDLLHGFALADNVVQAITLVEVTS